MTREARENVGNMSFMAAVLMRDRCADVCCKGKPYDPDAMLTEINPPGGYGQPQVLVCDEGMRSGRWDHWKAEHWPNWPEPRKA